MSQKKKPRDAIEARGALSDLACRPINSENSAQSLDLQVYRILGRFRLSAAHARVVGEIAFNYARAAR